MRKGSASETHLALLVVQSQNRSCNRLIEAKVDGSAHPPLIVKIRSQRDKESKKKLGRTCGGTNVNPEISCTANCNWSRSRIGFYNRLKMYQKSF
jgi:hypothetical protein